MDLISVCICTFKRPDLLMRTLDSLAGQETDNLFDYSIVVVDNDAAESSRALVSSFAAKTPLRIFYVTEPKSNIALARNRAVESAEGDLVAFIDDDEIPPKRWLVNLYRALIECRADGVLGPVVPHFDSEPPRWVVSSKIYERRKHFTGEVLDWRDGRTANVLLKRTAVSAQKPPFRAEFLTGEDVDFFRRAIDAGGRFVWCQEALVYEVEPPERWRRRYLVRKALRRGASTLLFPSLSVGDVVKSLIAVPAYAICLPITAILRNGSFTVVLVKLCDHLGKLLALMGLMSGGYIRQ
jgi:glycosyltransferase involved in cell wall biosynthesis